VLKNKKYCVKNLALKIIPPNKTKHISGVFGFGKTEKQWKNMWATIQKKYKKGRTFEERKN